MKLENPVDKDKEIRREITSIVEESKGKCGHKRVTQVLQNEGLNINHKRVLKITREEFLLCTKFKTRSRKCSSYKGQIGEVVNNVVNRQFKTGKPNQLRLTGVTEFRIKGEDKELYLSPILDLYNSEIISYVLGYHPTIKLTNTMLKKALEEDRDTKDLTIHSSQGFHYRHSSWTNKLEKMDITQSMSRKDNCLDDSPMGSFSGISKQETFYGEDFKSYKHLTDDIEEYIKRYSEGRIKTKLNGMSPAVYRLHSA